MSYQLVIAEKPSVARSIAGVIGADKKQDGYYGNSVAMVNIQNPAFQRFHSLSAFHFRQSPFSTV